MFLWNRSLKKLLEVQKVGEDYRSWIFNSSKRFVTAQDLLQNVDVEGLQECIEKRLDLLCDSKEIANHQVYRFSQPRAITWLSGRVDKLVAKLAQMYKELTFREQIEYVGQFTDGVCSASAQNFTSDSSTTDGPRDHLRLAFDLVADYLPVALASQLATHLKIPTSDIENSQLTNGEGSEPIKGRKSGPEVPSDRPTEDYSSSLKEASSKGTEPLKKKVKQVRGTQAITSFFQKPSA